MTANGVVWRDFVRASAVMVCIEASGARGCFFRQVCGARIGWKDLARGAADHRFPPDSPANRKGAQVFRKTLCASSRVKKPEAHDGATMFILCNRNEKDRLPG